MRSSRNAILGVDDEVELADAVTRGLRREGCQEIEGTDLSRRINLDGSDDGLKQLADTFDGILERIDDASEAAADDRRMTTVSNLSPTCRPGRSRLQGDKTGARPAAGPA